MMNNLVASVAEYPDLLTPLFAVPPPVQRHRMQGQPPPPEATLSAPKPSGGKWTLEEDDKVRTMRRDGCSWAEIKRALPYRS